MDLVELRVETLADQAGDVLGMTVELRLQAQVFPVADLHEGEGQQHQCDGIGTATAVRRGRQSSAGRPSSTISSGTMISTPRCRRPTSSSRRKAHRRRDRPADHQRRQRDAGADQAAGRRDDGDEADDRLLAVQRIRQADQAPREPVPAAACSVAPRAGSSRISGPG
jgi:hypothetical protein